MRRNHLLLRTLVCASLAAVGAALAGSVAQGQSGVTVTFPTRAGGGTGLRDRCPGRSVGHVQPGRHQPVSRWRSSAFRASRFATSPCRAGGTINAADASVAFLYRGNSVAVNPGRNGRNFPIDTTKYQILSYKLNSNLAGQGPQIYWYHNSFQDPSNINDFGVRYAPTPTPQRNTDCDGRFEGSVGSRLALECGPAVGFRFDPNQRRYRPERVLPVGAVDQPRLAFSASTSAADRERRRSRCGTTATARSFRSRPGSPASFFDWNYGVLPPGNYTLTVTKPGAASGTATFTINHPPTIQVTDPSPTTGEDFATKVLGNAWDMSESADLQYTGVEHTTAVSFSGGVAQRPTRPTIRTSRCSTRRTTRCQSTRPSTAI